MLGKSKDLVKVGLHFMREIFAVVEGIQGFKTNSVNSDESSRAQLRRNIHRIEKGLIMKPRKSVFAKGYITETINLYESVLKSSNIGFDEWIWFSDVLDMYFGVVSHSEIIANNFELYQKIRFDEIAPDSKTHSLKKVPYKASQRPDSSITFEDLEKLFKRRRSVRFFTKKKPDIEAIRNCVTLASEAPSACNRQPFRFLYSDSDVLVSAIANCAGGTAGYGDNLPAIMVVVGDLSYFNNPFDRHVIYIDSSLFTMQLLLALETQGLSSCAINWPDYKVPDLNLRKLVDLKSSERVIMLIGIGYADENSEIPFSHKKTSKELLEVCK